MSNINITVPTSDCPRTGLPRVARYTNHSVHANGSVSVNYAIDTLDLHGDVYKANEDQGAVTYHSQPINHGDQTIESEMIPEIQALLNAEKPLLEDILNTINDEQEAE